MTVRDIRAHLAEMYQVEVSPDLISRHRRRRGRSRRLPGLAAGRACHDIPLDVAAFGNRDATYACNIAGMWPDPLTTLRTFSGFATTTPHSRRGGYTNFASVDDQQRTRDNYGRGHDRLQQIKRRSDPGNLFHLNHNIPPDA
jgi:hypothetical protein